MSVYSRELTSPIHSTKKKVTITTTNTVTYLTQPNLSAVTSCLRTYVP
jgi:hypothetical protein